MTMVEKLISGTVSVTGLRIFACHGVDAQERKVGNMFEVSVTVQFPCENAMLSDDVDDTISYADVVDIVKTEMAIPSKLLENVVWRIYRRLVKEYPDIVSGRVTLLKLQPPLNAEMASAGFSYCW